MQQAWLETGRHEAISKFQRPFRLYRRPGRVSWGERIAFYFKMDAAGATRLTQIDSIYELQLPLFRRTHTIWEIDRVSHCRSLRIDVDWTSRLLTWYRID